ncbi:MAG: endonuclease MutS2, partial [Treponema sp.]|nr:endonuclease MutS2 [Treponema sp.]
MDEKTLSEIDYFRIREEIAGYCVSSEGRAALLDRLPSSNPEEIENWKSLSREWTLCHSTSKGSVLKGWEACNSLIPIIKTNGSALSLEQLRALGQLALSVQAVKKYLSIHTDELELKFIPQEAEKIPDFTETENKIFRVITTDGELRDLPEIAAIRKQIASLHSKIKTIMQAYISDQKYASILESTVPVLRGERQVLAVKASLQNRIPGIIYEVSQSGQTVYIEPEDAVLCSNELIQKEYELQAVIKKILTELTASLQPSIPAFNAALPVMCLFDTTQAAARWGSEHNCSFAISVDSNKQPPMLIQARHPLLGQKAVPIDIRFMEGKRVLIITGPNTGGKTVSLKTFALLSMLNQSGFPIPAGEGSRLPVFSSIFADIGDDQSLDQSLSTFSGHMKNIAQAVSNADSSSLILLDELGSGTDPQEGTAISMAVLDQLIKKQSFVLVTTHQGILKNYGYTNPSCINASVEFNQ